MAIDPRAKDIAPKVVYEFEMMEWISNKIITKNSSADQPTKNMLLEVFLLHTRVLYDFFILAPKHDDDVSAQHFFDDPSTWDAKKELLCKKLKSEQTRLNKKLAHLTYKRLSEKEEWEIIGIRDEIFIAKKEFLSALAVEQRQWFK